MYYVLIENNKVISALNYKPNVPDTIDVVEVTDDDHINITENKTHYFDLETKTVQAYSQDQLDQAKREKEISVSDAENREFLNSTDWKILRHIRQKALGVSTSLTDEEYIELEQQRADAAARIVNN